jgi:small subunit ribosomal protein S11
MQNFKNLILSNHFGVFRVLSNSVHTSRPCLKAEDRKEMLASMPVKDEGTEGEKTISIDTLIQK